ncbi:hypothetical protein ILYODFUR_009588, partial [Ilyodon furcidens]
MWTHSPGNSHLKVNNPPSCHSPSLSLGPGTQTYPKNGITYILDILCLLLRAYLPPKSLTNQLPSFLFVNKLHLNFSSVSASLFWFCLYSGTPPVTTQQQ